MENKLTYLTMYSLSELKELANQVEHEISVRMKALEEKNKIDRLDRENSCPEHEYVYTNAMWQSANQRRCIHCGKTIN